MKYHILLLAVTGLLAACDANVNVPPKEEKTTIINPPAEKKVEHNTTVVTPAAPAPADKK
jgi:hypothetical protein